MVFTEEDHVVIKFLRQNKGYSARRMVKEFLLKKWKSGSLNKLLIHLLSVFVDGEMSLKLMIAG